MIGDESIASRLFFFYRRLNRPVPMFLQSATAAVYFRHRIEPRNEFAACRVENRVCRRETARDDRILIFQI